jgi:enhancer of mRNA-decapping protein 4
MREVMIPAYEAATRQMFEQTSISLEQGLAQVSMNQTNSSGPALLAMSTQMTKMSEAIQSLSAEVAQLRGAVDASGANQTNGNFRGIQEGTPQPLGIRDEIAALCQAQRYEDAFTKAVSASDGDLVLYACKMADCEAVFSRDVSVSQPIMICLLQQLGAVLVPAMDPEDIKTILKWLQEIAVTIDPSNINIKRRKFVCMMLDLVSLSV